MSSRLTNKARLLWRVQDRNIDETSIISFVKWMKNKPIYYLFILEKFCLSRRVLSRIKGIHKSRRYERGGGRFAKAQRFTLIYKMYIIKWSTLGGVKNVNKISHQCGLWMTTFLTSYLIKFVRMINFEFILLKYYCC